MVCHILQHNALVHVVKDILPGFFQQSGASHWVTLSHPCAQFRFDQFQPLQHLLPGGKLFDALPPLCSVDFQKCCHGAVNSTAKPECLTLLVRHRTDPVDGTLEQQFTRSCIFGVDLGLQPVADAAQCKAAPFHRGKVLVKHGVAAKIIVVVSQTEQLPTAALQTFRPCKTACSHYRKLRLCNGAARCSCFFRKNTQAAFPCILFQLPAEQKQGLALCRRVCREQRILRKGVLRHFPAKLPHPLKRLGTLFRGEVLPAGHGAEIHDQIGNGVILQCAVFCQQLHRIFAGVAGLTLHQA